MPSIRARRSGDDEVVVRWQRSNAMNRLKPEIPTDISTVFETLRV